MADDRSKQPPNALATAATGLVDRAKAGTLLTPRLARVIGISLVVLLALGVWWFLARQSRQAASRSWADFAQPGVDLADYAARNKDSTTGRIARLEQARMLAGPQGIATLGGNDREARNKGINNLVTAREEFGQLAQEFAEDKSLAALCLTAAADVELALVGVPKDANTTTSLGQVPAAVEFLRQAARTLGEGTPAAEKLLARATELETNADQIRTVGEELNRRYNLPPAFTAPLPPTGTPPSPSPELVLPTLPDLGTDATTPTTRRAPEPAPTTPTTGKQ